MGGGGITSTQNDVGLSASLILLHRMYRKLYSSKANINEIAGTRPYSYYSKFLMSITYGTSVWQLD